MSGHTKRVGMAEIAKQAGVSKAAVSVALSGRRSGIGVSDATRERILAVAKKAGYVINPLARNLAMNKSNLIALLGREAFFVFALETIKGIEAVLRASDYSLLMYYDGSWAEDQTRHLALATSRRADGLIIVGAPEAPEGPNHQRVEALRKEGMPMVQLYRSMYPGIPTVMVDETQAGYQAVQHLVSLGHTRIAHVTHDGYRDNELPGKHSDALRRFTGYERAMRDAGLTPKVYTYPYGYPHDLAYIKQASQPLAGKLDADGMTAAFCFCDYVAVSLSEHLQHAGVSVPEKISLIGYDNIELASLCSPSLTTFGMPLQQMGSMAASMIFSQMQGESVCDVTLPPSLQLRESTAEYVACHTRVIPVGSVKQLGSKVARGRKSVQLRGN